MHDSDRHDLDPAAWVNVEFMTPNWALGRPVMPGVWGFPFHDACWKLLLHVYPPIRHDLHALNYYLMSRMLVSSGHRDTLDMGHDYGGVLELENHRMPMPGMRTEIHFRSYPKRSVFRSFVSFHRRT